MRTKTCSADEPERVEKHGTTSGETSEVTKTPFGPGFQALPWRRVYLRLDLQQQLRSGAHSWLPLAGRPPVFRSPVSLLLQIFLMPLRNAVECFFLPTDKSGEADNAAREEKQDDLRCHHTSPFGEMMAVEFFLPLSRREDLFNAFLCLRVSAAPSGIASGIIPAGRLTPSRSGRRTLGVQQHNICPPVETQQRRHGRPSAPGGACDSLSLRRGFESGGETNKRGLREDEASRCEYECQRATEQ